MPKKSSNPSAVAKPTKCPVTNKNSYPDKASAKFFLIVAGRGRRIYKCEHCQMYHITSKK